MFGVYYYHWADTTDGELLIPKIITSLNPNRQGPYFRSSLRTKIRLRTILGQILVLSAIIEHVAT